MSAFQWPPYSVETDRLLLRCWTPSDASELRSALDISADNLRPWVPFMKDEPRSLRQTALWLADHRARFDLQENFRFAVIEKESETLVGENMLLTRAGEGALEIGYVTYTGHEGKGFATEASSALVRVAFELFEVNRLEIHCAPENNRSTAIPVRLGFSHEATLRHRFQNADGQWMDLMIFTMQAGEYTNSPGTDVNVSVWDCLGQQLL